VQRCRPSANTKIHIVSCNHRLSNMAFLRFVDVLTFITCFPCSVVHNVDEMHMAPLICFTRAYPKVSGLAAWSENCKWYGFLPLGAVVSLFVRQSSEFCRHNPLYCFSTSVYCCLFRYRLSPEIYGYTLLCYSTLVFRKALVLIYRI
jgi:hypothetical protein